MAQKSNSQGTYGVNSWQIYALKKPYNILLYENSQLLGNSEPFKIRLLQCYEVLWIHYIDTICTCLTPSILDGSL